jgi:hypothetical protein
VVIVAVIAAVTVVDAVVVAAADAAVTRPFPNSTGSQHIFFLCERPSATPHRDSSAHSITVFPLRVFR